MPSLGLSVKPLRSLLRFPLGRVRPLLPSARLAQPLSGAFNCYSLSKLRVASLLPALFPPAVDSLHPHRAEFPGRLEPPSPQTQGGQVHLFKTLPARDC